MQALVITKNDPLNYQVFAEPGRFFSGDCYTLCTRVIGDRIKNNRKCIHINESLYHAFNCIILDGVSFERDNQQFYNKI